MTVSRKDVSNVLDCMLECPGINKATKYLSEKLIIRGTRRTYKTTCGNQRKLRKTDPIEILFTIGRPNFKERAFIKNCKKVDEPFPVLKVQFEFDKKKK